MRDLRLRYEILQRVLHAVSSCQNRSELIDALADQFRELVPFDYFAILIRNRNNQLLTFSFAGVQPDLDETICWEDGPGQWMVDNNKPFIAEIEQLTTLYPKMSKFHGRQNLQCICSAALTTSDQTIGCIEFLSTVRNAYNFEDGIFVQHAAAHIAIALENVLNREALLASTNQIKTERDRLSTLLDVANAVSSKREIHDLLDGVATSIRKAFRLGSIYVLIHSPEENCLQRYELTGECPSCRTGSRPLDQFPWDTVFHKHETILLQPEDVAHIATRFPQDEVLQSLSGHVVCCLPLVEHGICVGVLVLAHLQRATFSDENMKVFEAISDQLAVGIENTHSYQEILRLKDKLTAEKLYLEEEVRAGNKLGNMIGNSEALQSVIARVEIVASSDKTTVLIQGETGTGKEMIARAIHEASTRRNHALVKLNCAAIPAGLLESELFGHERGAFTSAVGRKIGRFEMAHQGTLFLDEIGDIPLELQPKLLRALQEREFERLGGSTTIKVDVRIIAATNRDLRQMMNDRLFRADLYYRLSVFPLLVPPLRQRRDDIPPLIHYFVRKYAHSLRRNIESISTDTMRALCAYSWPGNIRELENLIERSVLLSKGAVLRIPISEIQDWDEPGIDEQVATEKLHARRPVPTEREAIENALRAARGVVAGPAGAAASLGLKRTTLLSRMKKMRVSSSEFATTPLSWSEPVKPLLQIE